MPPDNQYIALIALASEWAAEAGMPKEMVLRNICDWAIADAFPMGAFVTPTGEKVDPFDIFMSGRALAPATFGGIFGGIELDGATLYGQRWGLDLLLRVLLTARDVRSFCENTNTRPPPPLRTGFERFWVGRSTDKHFAPPPCPEAEERAAKRHARDSAIGMTNRLRAILAGLQRKPGPRRMGQPYRMANEPIDVDAWQLEWTKTRERVWRAIARCGDDSLQQELDELNVEWASFIAAETSAATPAPKSKVGEMPGTVTGDREMGAEIGEPPISKRAAGQYSKARLAEWYGAWVDQNEARGTIPSRDEDWRAAKAALGEGVPRDDVRELRKIRSPENWQRKGRRKSAEKGGD